ncbi:MAG TPA: DUF4262 domain-containing protein [Myxococcota bacterium]|nr:DUF4262 domain-containing protein [Myxococcota bacterium]
MQESADIDARVRADIARFGWHLVLIPPEHGAPGWVHTIGLEERFAHPELIAFGNDLSVLAPLLNALGERVREGSTLTADSEAHGVLEGLPVAFRSVASKWIEPFLGNAAWHYQRETIPALQCFWPDPNGRFPWQADFDPAWREDQPLLFERETHRALSERMVAALRADGAL